MLPASFDIRVLVYAHAPLAALKVLDTPGIAVCGVVRSIDELADRAAHSAPGQILQQPDRRIACKIGPKLGGSLRPGQDRQIITWRAVGGLAIFDGMMDFRR